LRRLHHTGDVRILVEEALAVDPAIEGGSTLAVWPRRWIAAGLVAAVLGGFAIGMLARRSTSATRDGATVSLPFDGRPAS
jgi:hypothetical protein